MQKISILFFSLLAYPMWGSLKAEHLQSASTFRVPQKLTSPACDPNIFVKLAKTAIPSVVNISTTQKVKSPYVNGAEEFFKKFFEGQIPDTEGSEGKSKKIPTRKAVSLGTGFIIEVSTADETVLILTNNHVVSQADEIKISFTEAADEKPADGVIVGRDPELDVALVKVKTKKQLIPLQLGDSDALEVGEFVGAIGNPFGQGHSLTHGIISATGRAQPIFPMSTYIQTDAPINFGNSGGPLLNLKSEVIGINNAIHAGAQGIGFAIPINAVKKVLPQLKKSGSVKRGFIGVSVQELTEELYTGLNIPSNLKAPLVADVSPNSPAQQAGLKPYDLILEVNGKKVITGLDLVNNIANLSAGEMASLKVWRQNKTLDIKIKTTERPSPESFTNKKQKKEDNGLDYGMEISTLTPEIAKKFSIPITTGVIVTDISFNKAADQSGLWRGDIIVEVNRKPIKTVEDFESIVNAKGSYILRVKRQTPQTNAEVYTIVTFKLE